jgi:hypothetical protein
MAYYGHNDGRFVFHNESSQSIGLQVNGFNAENGLLVYSNKVAFVNNVEITGSLSQGLGIASGSYSHAEGDSTKAIGDYSHAEGQGTIAYEGGSHAEGRDTITSGSYSHAEGQNTIASGSYSHAEGSSTKAIGDWSHAEGDFAQAKGEYSHAEGNRTIASGSHSHAEGNQTIALGNYQHVQGQYNSVSSVPAAFIVGNGTDNSNRSNLIHAAGNEVQISGSLILSGSTQYALAYFDTNLSLRTLPTPITSSGDTVAIFVSESNSWIMTNTIDGGTF